MPIVEPEVLPDGEHDLETAKRVTEQVRNVNQRYTTVTMDNLTCALPTNSLHIDIGYYCIVDVFHVWVLVGAYVERKVILCP